MANEENVQIEESPIEFKEVCGIKVAVDSKVPEDDIIRYKDSIKDFTAIEVLHEIKRFEEDAKTVAGYKKFFEDSKVTLENFKEAARNLGDIRNELAAGEGTVITKINDDELAEEDVDFDKIFDEIKDYEERTNIGLSLLKQRYDTIRESGGMSLKDDIIETLRKNISTVENSSDLNKEFFAECMKNTIAEFDNSPTGVVDPYDRMASKLNNPKRLKDMKLWVAKNMDKARKEYISVSFNDEMYKTFLSFIVLEEAFFVYTHDSIADPNEPPRMIEDEMPFISTRFTFDLKWGKKRNAIEFFGLMFFYHISRIVKNEAKKRNYLSLIYKCYILQALELLSLKPDSFRNTPEGMEARKNFQEGTEEYEISIMRQKLYKSYSRIFWAYLMA